LKFPDKPGHGIAPCREFDLDDILDRLDGGRSFGFDFDAWHYGRHWGKALTPYLYTGRRIDGFSNLYNNRNRMLNTRVGRFLSRDPIGFNGGLNLFGYAKNNPLRFLDPFGLLTKREALEHYWGVDGMPGEPLDMAFDELYKTGSLDPTQFPKIWAEIGKKRCEDLSINIDDSIAFKTSGGQAFFLGTIGIKIFGTLRITKEGTWSFDGKYKGLTDQYDFDPGNRGFVGETLATIGRLFTHGTRYFIRINGTQDVSRSGNLPAVQKPIPSSILSDYWKGSGY